MINGQTDDRERILRNALNDLPLANAQLRRLSGPAPTIESCPSCFYLRGRTKLLVIVPHDTPEKHVKLECRFCGSAVEGRLN